MVNSLTGQGKTDSCLYVTLKGLNTNVKVILFRVLHLLKKKKRQNYYQFTIGQ